MKLIIQLLISLRIAGQQLLRAAAEICVPEFDSLKNMLLRQRETMHEAAEDVLTAQKCALMLA